MDRMPAIGQHAFGQPVHAPADLPVQRALELAVARVGLERGDFRQQLRDGFRGGELSFERGDPGFQSCHALSELAQVISAVPR